MLLLFNRQEDQEKTNRLVRSQHHVCIDIHQKTDETITNFHESRSEGSTKRYGLITSKESLKVTHQKTVFKPMKAQTLWTLLKMFDQVVYPWLNPVLFFGMDEIHELATKVGAKRFGLIWASSPTDTNLPYVVGRMSYAAKDMDDFMFSSQRISLACFSITDLLQEFIHHNERPIKMKERQDVTQKTFKKVSPKNFQKSFIFK